MQGDRRRTLDEARCGGTWACDGRRPQVEVALEYSDGSLYEGVSIMEVGDGKIVTETDYFAQRFAAPQWRAQWVRRMPR